MASMVVASCFEVWVRGMSFQEIFKGEAVRAKLRKRNNEGDVGRQGHQLLPRPYQPLRLLGLLG